MTAALDTVITADAQARPLPAAVKDWELPESDQHALITWGLPADGLMTPDFQTQPDPLLVPNVARPHERRLISSSERLYRLGRWGSHDLTPWMGAVAGDGRVLAIREKPLTAEDLHPDLREHYRGLYKPAVDFINSSVAQFIEVAWRWRAAIEVLGDLKEPDPLASLEEWKAYFTRIEACERIVLAHIERIDSQVRTDDLGSLWKAVVTDPGC